MTQDDKPLEYIQRTRAYYLALGYETPYKWAHYQTVPFTRLGKPLNQCRVAIATTASPYHPDKGDQGPGAPYNSAAKFFSAYRLPVTPWPDVRISHIAIDRDHTTAEDLGSYFPLAALQLAEQNGLIGESAKHFYGLPTNRSHSTTLKIDSQALLSHVRNDGIDIVLLVPNCPVCHQSVSIAARVLEANGVVTVIMGCAKDIVEHVGVPRFVFSDFPLGNSAGIPNDDTSQNEILYLALNLAVTATLPRSTSQSPFQWPGAANWKDDYSNANKLSEEEIQQRRIAFDKDKETAKSVQYRR
ncbi:MAG: glycine reductase [Gammaproteobacteria bacterium]|nr:glycine reductase [Gammaproteobacteria bacterium]